MAVRFPDTQAVDPAETHINHSYDHLIACVNGERTPGELWYPHGVALDSNKNQIYVAERHFLGDPSNIARVSLFSETGEFINMFSHPLMKWPCGIAIHGDNVFVTDKEEHSVFHFKMGADFHLVSRLGSRGSDIGQFDVPGPLAVSTNGEVFVTDCYNDRIQILMFDSKLHYQRHIVHRSLVKPSDIKLTPDEVFVLCETSPCIKVFTNSGFLIRSLITSGCDGFHVIDPSFFCLDARSNILLSDCSDHQIKIFSKEGTLLHTLGEFGHELGMFFLPQGIVFTNNLKLVIVSRNKNYCLQIFSFD